jgi:uncharacterized protein HemX
MPIQKVNNVLRPVDAPKQENTPRANKSGNKLGLFILILIAIIAIAGFVWSFKKYVDTKKQLTAVTSVEGQQEMAKQEVQKLLEKVGKLIILPADEEPTVATIADVDALKKEQSFYADAQNGNKVLIYMQAKKAIIYDEERNILINVGPIFMNENIAPASTDSESVN